MPEQEPNEILRMQDGIRGWVRRTARRGSDGLRTASPTALLSLVCASAVGSVVTADVTGIDPAAVASIGLVSSVGGNVLSSVVTDALGRLRKPGKAGAPPGNLEDAIAEQIQKVLSAGGANAEVLRTEIALVLKAVNASGIALQASIETGNAQIHKDIVSVFGELSANFAELHFLLDSIDRAAMRIQDNQDEQGRQLRGIQEQASWARTEIRLVREEIAAWQNRLEQTPGGPAGHRPRWTGGCPYRGLLPFTEAEAGVFYGRERVIADLTGRLSQLPDRAGLVIVTGASGAGKSSLLNAGLLPALASGLHLAGSQHWPRIVMTPGKDPLAELAMHLAALGGGSRTSILDDLYADPGNAHLTVRQAVIADARRAGNQEEIGNVARLVLVVDQLEQIFTPGADGNREPGTQAFITALCAAATRPAGPEGDPPALVILAVRGDYWDECAAYPQLARALQDSSFVVGPMTETELRLAITSPAEAAGLQIEDALTDAILSDLNSADRTDTQGILPLMSQAMLLTWENRDGSRLTAHGYSQVGGIANAVKTSADAVYDALPPEQQTLTREILTRMTAASSNRRFTRRTVRREDLYGRHPDIERGQIDTVLEAFADKRLVVLGDGTAEISHEALLQAWPRLRDWLEEDQTSLILHTQLAEDSLAWQEHDEDRSFLYRGTQLAAVRQAAARWSTDPGRYQAQALTSTERGFLEASDHAANRAARQRQIISGVLVLLVIASLTGAGIAINAANTARQQTAFAVSGELATQSEALDSSDPYTASLLAAASWHIDQKNPLAHVSLLDAYAQPTRGIMNVDPAGDATGVALSSDGKTLATAGSDGDVRLWNTSTRTQVGPPIHVRGSNDANGTTFDNGVNGVALSSDGKTLATAGSDGDVRLWNTSTHAQAGPPIRIPGSSRISISGVRAVALSSDGKTLATAGPDGDVRLWNTSTHAQTSSPIHVPGSNGANGVAFSPVGKTLATVGGDGDLRLWNAADHMQVAPPIDVPGSNSNGVYGVAFSPDGKTLATAGPDGDVRLWNTSTHAQTSSPIHVPGSYGVYGVALSSDGKTLATAGSDGDARLWNLTIYGQVSPPIAVPGSNSNGVYGVVFSPDGKTLATTGGDGALRLWNAATRTQAGLPITVPGDLYGMAFSPDGKTLATTGGDEYVRFWNTVTRTQVAPPIHVFRADGIALDPDGKILATTGGSGDLRLWNAATHVQTGPPITAPGGLFGVVFSPDGKTFATAGGDENVRFWNTATHAQTGPPIPVPGGVSEVAFSPDGKTLATAGSDGDVRLWNISTRTQIGPPIAVPGSNSSGVYGVVFSPDGKTIATAGSDGNVRLWDVAFPEDLFKAVCAITGRSFTRSEWSAYVPSEPFQKVCP